MAETQRQGHCKVPTTADRPVMASADVNRVRAIRQFERRWVNGTTLNFHFPRTFRNLGRTVRHKGQVWEESKDAVRAGFKLWAAQGIGLVFEETDDVKESEIRIGFDSQDGSWSYIGRDVLNQARDAITMNFGWDIRQDPDTVTHEIGHTLGLPHEHQNPNAGIVWDEEAVYKAMAAAPGFWPREDTYSNILRKIPKEEVDGGAWDPNSIMHYWFAAGQIKRPHQYYKNGLYPAGGLSPDDKKWIRTFYPAPEKNEQLDVLRHEQAAFHRVRKGLQVNMEVRVPRTGSYTFQTVGEADTVMVLFRMVDGRMRRVKGDDDSGMDKNAHFTCDAEAGTVYTLRVRVVWPGPQNRLGVIYF